MGIFKKSPPPHAVAVQTGLPASHPFSKLERYVPLSAPDYGLYRTMREAVPVLDAAVGKLTRLVGGFTTVCGDERAKAALDQFLHEVRVGAGGHGIETFVSAFLEQLLVNGTAVGEMVLDASRSDIYALYNAPLQELELRREDNPLQVTVCRREGMEAIPAPYQELILLAALNPEPGQATGTSLFRSLPFVTSILLKIYQTMGVNFDRVGNLRFAVTYKPQNDAVDKAFAKERAMQIAAEWSRAMDKNSTVKDFVAVGDVSIKVIGADNQILDTEVPVRQMLEQIVAKTGLPPFMLGLNWSTTERMSTQQADILTSELEAYRRCLTPVLEKICSLWLRLHGYGCPVTVDWDIINLQDEVEMARARLLRAQAAQIEETLENGAPLPDVTAENQKGE